MNQEKGKSGKEYCVVPKPSASRIETQSLLSAPLLLPAQLYFLSRKSLSSIPAFLISILSYLGSASGAFAGDAVAIGYNKDGVWTSLTYYSSSTPKGGKDYKTEAEARDEALGDLRKRGGNEAARAEILSSSDTTGFVAVARGKDNSKKDANVVGRGKSQAEADEKAMVELKKAGATKNQQIVYRYFSRGSRTGD